LHGIVLTGVATRDKGTKKFYFVGGTAFVRPPADLKESLTAKHTNYTKV
jgi:hypothetical protein